MKEMTTSVKNVLKEMKSNESSISMVLGGLVVLIVGILLFNYFRSTRPTAEVTPEGQQTTSEMPLEYQEENGQLVPKNLPTKYTVQKGDHLWGIATKFYGSGFNWVDIAEANKLGTGNQLEAGMELTIPKMPVKGATGTTQKTTEVAAKPEATPMATPVLKMETKKNDVAPNEKGAEVDMSKAVSGDSYTVQKGDSLWKVAVRAYGDGYQWTKIYEANKTLIKNSNYIEIGMKLALPR
jgi:nucleoid-associated protein YgaU